MPAHPFPALSADFEPTLATLHAYAQAVGSVPRAHGIAHPRWWHISLKVRPDGLVTDAVPLPSGGSLALRMNLHSHEIVAIRSNGEEDRIDMRSGATGTEMGEQILAVTARHGLDGGFARSRFESDDARSYDPAAASAYFTAFTSAHTVFERHRASIGDRVGPIQVWPHGFDLAFEWYGSKTEHYEGEDLPAQLNLGFYPSGDPYFYSTPWPYEASLTEVALPHGAEWNPDWNGAALPYPAVQDDPAAAEKVADFAAAVFAAAAPGLGS